MNKIKLLSSIVKHGMAKIITSTKPEFLKKDRESGEQTPAEFNDIVKLTMAIVSVGNDYSTSVNNRLDGATAFVSDTCKYSVEESENGLIRKGIKDSEQKYLRVYFNLAANKMNESCFFNTKTGEIIPSNQLENYLPKKSSSKKQLDAGLREEEQVVVRNFKLESVIYFQKGEAVINELSPVIMNIFNLEKVNS